MHAEPAEPGRDGPGERGRSSPRRSPAGPALLPKSAAAAPRPRSGAGCRPASRKARAAAGRQVPVGPGKDGADGGPRIAARVEQVQPPLLRPSSAGELGQGQGRAAPRRTPRPPAGPAAAGRTGPASVAADAGSASTRAPISVRSSATASARRQQGPGSRRWAPSRATSPASESRLVTTTTAGRGAGQQRADLLDGRRRCRGGRASAARLADCGTARRVPRRPPGCPGRRGRARAGTRLSASAGGHAARPGRSRAGSHRAARRGTGAGPGAPSARRARSCRPRPSRPRRR